MDKRQAFFAKFDKNPAEVLNDAKTSDKAKDLTQHFQNEAPKGANSWNHRVAIDDYLHSKGLNVFTQRGRPASHVRDFNSNAKRLALSEKVEQCYNAGFTGDNTVMIPVMHDQGDRIWAENYVKDINVMPRVHMSVIHELEDSSTIEGFTPNTPQRPSRYTGLMTPPYQPDVNYMDLAPVEFRDTIDLDVPVFKVPATDMAYKATEEGIDPPEINLAIESEKAQAYRYAIRLNMSQTQMQSASRGVIEGIIRMASESGARYAQSFAEDTADLIAKGVSQPTAVSAEPEAIFEFQNSLPTGRTMDMIIGLVKPVAKYMGGIGKTPALLDRQTPQFTTLGNFTLVNNTAGRQSGAMFKTATTNVNSTSGVWGYDRMWSVLIFEYSMGSMDAEEFNISTAMHHRVLARWMGLYEKDDKQVKGFNMS